MPSLDKYKENHSRSGTKIGQKYKNQSDLIMDKTFDRDPTYRMGMLYNANLEPIEMVEFKFQKAQVYTINKDQVEYFVQFRPSYHPEKLLNTEDKIYRLYEDEKERLSFYLDIPDDNGDIYKWLIVGRNNDNAFVRYNVLQCNWNFEWMIDRQYYSCLGVMRSRSGYNSGVWSDGTTTSIENQTAFFVPTNNITRTIDYDLRFMITDNPIHPKTYEVSKVEDTFPLGLQKITLKQDHYNKHTDICKVLDEDPTAPPELKDGKMHMICNYIKSGLPPIVNEEEKAESVWYLSEVGEKLYINSNAQVITAMCDDEDADNFDDVWNIELDGEYYPIEELEDYFEIDIDAENHSLTIRAISSDLAKYMLKVSIGSEDGAYYDYVEMEVSN